MKLDLTPLKFSDGGSKKYHFCEQLPDLELGGETYVFLSPVNVELQVTKSGRTYFAKGLVKCTVEASCSKCLKKIPFTLEFNFEDEFVPAHDAPNSEEDSFFFENDSFSIAERISEHILLHLPMRFTCSESCRGLCPQCGINLNTDFCNCKDENIDPRLEILSKWNKGV
ncbi:MAG: YceD family protein [Desulfitobacteriia bacterium]